MASVKDTNDVFTAEEKRDVIENKDIADLPPSGTSLHKRRRGEPPATLTVKSPQTPSDAEGSSPCTAGPTPDDYWSHEPELSPDSLFICESMIQRLKDKDDPLSKHSREIAIKTKGTVEIVDQLEKLLGLLDQFVNLKAYNEKLMRKLNDVEHLKRLHEARKKISIENERIKAEEKELQWINEALESEFDLDYGQAIFDSVLGSGRMKRTGSKWKSPSRFGGSLLRKQRSRSAGGEDSDVAPSTPLRRRSEALSSKEVEKSKVSKWTKVKSAFRWEKALWPATVSSIGGAAGAVAAGAMVGAVALAGSAPSSVALPYPEPPRDSASLTPGSAMSLTPNSSCEELRLDAGSYRKSGTLRSEENYNAFLHAPTQDDSSTSPSPNKLHKSPWGKMRDIIQTRRESVRKKTTRLPKGSQDVAHLRRRSLSDGGDSDAPPALTITIPSSEELESEPCHPVLRKQRSLELSARPPQQRPPRASKWSKVKRAFLTSSSASVPSSPNRHSAFFTDAETEDLSSGCEASGVREEIARDYAALQTRLRREFSDRREKLSAASRPAATEEQLSANFRKKLTEWQRIKSVRQPPSIPSRQDLNEDFLKKMATSPVATEEQLSANFRKKLTEWQRMKGVRQPPPVPARQDLSEDFLKRWDEWKQMKETNSVPAWEEEAKPDEVLVQTSTGLFKFQGISRSFTRKIHEWEKFRGIPPEVSTSALLKAARVRGAKSPTTPLTRTQSDGSVAPSATGSDRLHASSLSVNDADHIDLEFNGDNHSVEEGEDACDGDDSRGAVIVEVEAEEVCTAAPLVAVSPRHTPQKPVYTYGNAEARLLCETNSAVTGTAIVQPSDNRNIKSKDKSGIKSKAKATEKNSSNKKKVARQTSIEEDAKFIRKTIEEIERGSSSRHKEDADTVIDHDTISEKEQQTTSAHNNQRDSKEFDFPESSKYQDPDDPNFSKDDKRKEDKANGKKKSKSRARLEREQSKPSESDTEPDIDTVTVEIPKRRKRLRRQSERPKTPPTSLHSDSEGEVFVLKLKAPEPRDGSPEVIVKTTRKIFSPVVRSGETVPRAVIPLDVEDLAEVKPIEHKSTLKNSGTKKRNDGNKQQKKREETTTRSKSSGDLQDNEEQRPRNRPPLPLSPSSQRKPQPKETAPSIRIMIQRYNMKINEEGHTSGASSGASSPAWRSPSTERRRPPDMPVGVNIRNNPFLEREVQKSASACQLSRRERTSSEKPLTPTPAAGLDGVLKSQSANALLSEHENKQTAENKNEDSKETNLGCNTASTDTIVPDITKNMPILPTTSSTQTSPLVFRQVSEISAPCLRMTSESPNFFERSISVVDSPMPSADSDMAARMSERAARIKEARERFLSSPAPIRREGTSSASDLRPGDRSSRISCESESAHGGVEESPLGRSASTGMVNVDREAWERVAEGNRGTGRSSRSRFSLARLAAKLRRKDEGAVSRLCRQSLLVQLRNKQ